MYDELDFKSRPGILELLSDHSMAESLKDFISSKFVNRFGDVAKLLDIHVRKYPGEFSAVAFCPPEEPYPARLDEMRRFASELEEYLQENGVTILISVRPMMVAKK